jgi:pilus assembly protein CpaD
MRTKFIALTAAALAVTGCTTDRTPNAPQRGLAAVHVPVVTSANYVYDLNAPGGTLAPGEAERLDGWFHTLGLGYGDSVYVDGGYADAARGQIARVAGQYGMLVEPGAPVTAGAIQGDSVRVIVERRRAEVPGCPDWTEPSQPSFGNHQMSNFGCGVNSNLAMQVANPEDLLHGQPGSAAVDAVAGAKAIQLYRNWPLTGIVDGRTQRQLDVVADDTKGSK